MQAVVRSARRLAPAAARRGGAPCRALATSSRADAAPKDALDAPEDDDVDALGGKLSGEHLRSAFAARAAAAVRYDYFAQRSELEAELEAASTFRALKSVAEQQALGFLELLEEYGSGTGGGDGTGIVIGTTVDNVAGAAMAEKADVELYRQYAEAAEKDGMEQLSEWMADMSDASDRVADRLELVSSLMDDEFEEMGEMVDDEAAAAAPAGGKPKSA
jgi:rubrerythrin